jgi:hypothetical protein
MTTRDEAKLALEALEATIRSQRAAMNKGSVAQILPALNLNAEPAQPTDEILTEWEAGIEELEGKYDQAHSALTEGLYFADGRFKHPVDLVRASEKWSEAVAIVNDALAVAA